jgi:ABC-type transport system involved in multi-copper enzyme maturation permease subunit
MKPFFAWLRRQFAWSNSRRSWYERLGAAALLVTGAGGWWVSGEWPFEGRLLLAALWLVLLAILLRRGLVRLAGPVFFFEALRGSRRHVHLSRVVLALILLIAVVYIWLVMTQIDVYRAPDLQLQARLANTFFGAFFGVQLVVIGLMTPVMVAGAIAEEKERRTLEFVLATDLRSREIVLGKLAARLANLLLLLITGLPVLALLQFFGGVDPGELLAAFAVTLLTLLGAASLSILMSALLRRGRDAILSTYLLMLAYLALSGLAQAGVGTSFGAGSFDIGGWRVYGTDVIDAVGAGNPFVVIATLLRRLEYGSAFGEVLREVVRDYALFHGAVAMVCIVWAALRLRPVVLAQGGGGRRRSRIRARQLPDIGKWPMAWKEVFAEPGPRLHFILRLLLFLLVLVSFWPPIQITAEHWDELTEPILVFYHGSGPYGSYAYDFDDYWRRYHEDVNVWVIGMSMVVGTLLLMAVAVRAAGSVTGERSRQTLDDLLTTPLSNREIIHGKWLGCILGARRGWIWLGGVYFVGLCTGSLNPFACLGTIFAWFCFAGFFASLGLWFSVNSRSTFKSTAVTIICSAFILGLHWVVSGVVCFLPLSLAYSRESGELADWLAAFQLCFTPPFALGFIPFVSLGDFEWEGPMNNESIKFAIAAFVSVPTFLVLGLMLRSATVTRFARVFNRGDIRKPSGPRPKEVPALAETAKPAYTD